MRILIDTNILFSALLFPRSKPAHALLYAANNHEIVLCDRNIVELRNILKRKAPKFLPDVDIILTGDKDFLSLDIKHPKCMTVAQFLETEGSEE